MMAEQLAEPTLRIRSNEIEQTQFLVTSSVVGSIMVLIAAIAVYVKIVVRRVHFDQLAAEDLLCVVSWLIFTSMIGMLIYEAKYGGGSHQADLSPFQIKLVLHLIDIHNILYNAANCLSKTAVLLTYKNIFVLNRKSKEWWLIVTLVTANAIFYTVSTFIKIFRCNPREKAWDPASPGTCINLGRVLASTGSWNTICDVLVLLTPALFVSNLHLQKRVKWQVIGVFFIGALAYPTFSVGGAIFRALHGNSDRDDTYWQPRIALFADSEITAGLICAALPSLAFTIRRMRQRQSRYSDLERRRRLDLRLNPALTLQTAKPDHIFHRSNADAGVSPETQYLETVLEDIDGRLQQGHQLNFGGSQWLKSAPSRGGRQSRHSPRADGGEDGEDDIILTDRGLRPMPRRPKIMKTTDISVRFEGHEEGITNADAANTDGDGNRRASSPSAKSAETDRTYR